MWPWRKKRVMQNRRQMCCWKKEKSLKLNLKMTERGNNYDDGDYAHRDVPQTHQGVRWQNALGINMLLRCNKTSPRASTLHANFIRGAMRETRLSMQMRELSISKLQLVPAKCMITDVGFCAVTIIQMCKAFFELNPTMTLYTIIPILTILGLVQNEVC